jgi:hypothetical protein
MLGTWKGWGWREFRHTEAMSGRLAGMATRERAGRQAGPMVKGGGGRRLGWRAVLKSLAGGGAGVDGLGRKSRCGWARAEEQVWMG